MPRYKVYCAEVCCDYYEDGHCAAKNICLSAGEVSTVWEGRMHFWRCKTYKESERMKEIHEFLRKRGAKLDLEGE